MVRPVRLAGIKWVTTPESIRLWASSSCRQTVIISKTLNSFKVIHTLGTFVLIPVFLLELGLSVNKEFFSHFVEYIERPMSFVVKNLWKSINTIQSINTRLRESINTICLLYSKGFYFSLRRCWYKLRLKSINCCYLTISYCYPYEFIISKTWKLGWYRLVNQPISCLDLLFVFISAWNI